MAVGEEVRRVRAAGVGRGVALGEEGGVVVAEDVQVGLDEYRVRILGGGGGG